jgi:hypothetical protein
VTEVSPCSHLVSDACATINQARRLRWLRFSGPEPPQLGGLRVEPYHNYAALRIEVRACKCVFNQSCLTQPLCHCRSSPSLPAGKAQAPG